MLKNRAAKRNGIMQGIQALASNIGEGSRYISNKNLVNNAGLYNVLGEYMDKRY